MRAGQLTQRVSIERRLDTLDELNQPIGQWVSIVTTFASVEPLSGREYFAAAAMQSEITTRVTLRYRPGVTSADYRPGITSADRINHNGKVYGITSVIDHRSDHRSLVLMCRG